MAISPRRHQSTQAARSGSRFFNFLQFGADIMQRFFNKAQLVIQEGFLGFKQILLVLKVDSFG